jgi:hypothetical protein
MITTRLPAFALALGLVGAGAAAAQQTVPAPTPIPAPPPVRQIEIPTSHADAARELLTVSRTAEAFMQVLPNVMRQIGNTIISTNIAIQADPPRRTALEESLREVERQFEGDRDQMVATVALLYAARFTEAELRQLIDFYRSPLGQKYLQLTPQIANESVRSAQEWAQRLGQNAFQRVREDMRRRGHPLN